MRFIEFFSSLFFIALLSIEIKTNVDTWTVSVMTRLLRKSSHSFQFLKIKYMTNQIATMMCPKNFNSIHFLRFRSHEKPLLWSIDVSNSTPKYASNTTVNTPNAKLIILTQAKADVFLWPFDAQESVESRLHLLAETQASNISANTLRNRYSTKVKIPMERRTAASWKLRPWREAEIR